MSADRNQVPVLEGLFASNVYREDQKSFMLYPDRELPGFLAKNRISPDDIAAIPLLQRMLEAGDRSIVLQDGAGDYRFNANFTNVGELHEQLDALAATYGDEIDAARGPLHELFESVFNHQDFTGRSGTMFGFEGLGCIYWHMVSKLLLAAQDQAAVARRPGRASRPSCARPSSSRYQDVYSGSSIWVQF